MTIVLNHSARPGYFTQLETALLRFKDCSDVCYNLNSLFAQTYIIRHTSLHREKYLRRYNP